MRTRIVRSMLLVVVCLGLSSCGSGQPLESTHTPTVFSPSLPVGSSTVSKLDGMKLLYVPAGEFQMGSTEEQFQAGVAICTGMTKSNCESTLSIEKPEHKVYLDAFWIDQTEATNAMYEKCVSAGKCLNPSSPYPTDGEDDFPVTYVTWDQANIYCKWAGRSLPTEAQWEKAARGTDGRIFPWGNQFSDSNANSDSFAAMKVGSYPTGASPYGALDMAGNVSEWVMDWEGNNYYSNSPYRNPTGPTSGDYRLLRGGSFYTRPYNSRSTNRNFNYPNSVSDDVGFRCILNENPPTSYLFLSSTISINLFNLYFPLTGGE